MMIAFQSTYECSAVLKNQANKAPLFLSPWLVYLPHKESSSLKIIIPSSQSTEGYFLLASLFAKIIGDATWQICLLK